MERKTIKKMEGGVGTAGISKLRRRNIEIAETVTTTTPEALTEPKKRGGGMLDFLRKKKGNDVTSAQDVQATEQATAQAALIEPAQEVQATQAALIEPAQTTEPATAPAPAPQALASTTPPPALAPEAIIAKNKFLQFQKELQEQKDGCIAYYKITDCKGLQYSDDKDTQKSVEKRFEGINALLKQSLSTLVNQNNKLKLADNEIKNKNLEDLFKNLLYSFIEYLIKKIYDTTDIKPYVENIKHTTITDQNYDDGVMLVKKYINSYYSKGIAILTDNDDVKYYKYDNDTYTVNTTITLDNKDLTNFFILRIINKKIMIHQIFQQIISGLIDTITKDDVIFNKYYSLK